MADGRSAAAPSTAASAIIVPVYNGLALLRHCLRALLRYSGDARLILVNDASDEVTTTFLRRTAAAHAHVTLIEHEINLGFVRACNAGIARAAGATGVEFVVLVNSDVIVTPDWLARLLACAASDPRIGSVNPLTNHASQIAVPLAPGLSFVTMDRHLRARSPRAYPDVVTGVGFCMLLRRAALDRVGVFDEAYGRGYCEESDLCMRLTTRGFRTVVADDVYVYHRGRGSFTDRDERYRVNRRLFDRRWRQDYQRQYRAFLRRAPLAPARALFALPTRRDPRPAGWAAARDLLAQWRRRDPVGLARAGWRGALNVMRARRPVVAAGAVERFADGRLSVTYVLHRLLIAGGVLSVIQLVNELILLGVEARIVALYQDPALRDWTPLLTEPIIYRSEAELMANFPASDIAVATLHQTAPWVARLVAAGRAVSGAYFIQDYEPWFYPERDRQARARVLADYRRIGHRIVKSDWLQNMLADDDIGSHKIALGMNLDIFYPRRAVATSADARAPTVIAMARPQTPRRGFPSVVAALAAVKAARPDCRVVLFGDRFLLSQNIPFAFEDAGVVTRQNALAELYSDADVFLDGSDFQGFGRCALEAMACGAACVVTGVGGVTEYAEHRHNCLVVPPRQPQRFAEAILRLLDDPALRATLAANAARTVRRYALDREARETRDYFFRIAGRAAPDADT